MTNKSSAPSPALQPARSLSWLIGGTALLFYCSTLNHWLALHSLETLTRGSGWWPQPGLGRPLTLLAFAPLKLLPTAWLPWLANLLTAGVAAGVLHQLARSVAMLQHDVAPDGPAWKHKANPALLTGPLAWLPPVFATAICGLQLGFWEHATAASGEMLSLLCFAVAFRCVLEFRLDPRDSWLYRATLAYALGMTDSWLLIGYLPAFAAAVIWVKGYSKCLNGQFLLRLTGAALTGLSLYLLVPMLQWATSPEPLNFWPALKFELGVQKQALQIFHLPALRLLVLTAALPFLLLAVKWRSHTVQLADDTHVGVFFAKASGHFTHALLFLAALWLALNATIIPRQVELRTPLLLYHYTWALVAGHCAGYLLLFGKKPQARRQVKWPAAVALILLVLLPAGLLWKNFHNVRLTNGGALREFARQLCDDLPAGRVTVLSDDTTSLLLAQAELAARGRAQDVLLVDTPSLPRSGYHRHLRRTYGDRWPDMIGTNRTEALRAVQLLAAVRQIATNEPVVYLQPSSGFFFETFTATPHGWVQQLESRSPENLTHPTTTQTIAANEQLWQARWTNELATRAEQFETNQNQTKRWTQPPVQAFKLSSRANETAALLAGAYSKVLNHWGVLAQRAGLKEETTFWFHRALAFDPDNLTALINLEFATRHQRGITNRLTLAWLRETHPKELSRYDRWAEVISRCGPVDEPTFLFHSGRMYLAANNPRQALEAFARSAELAGDWIAPQLAQAQCQNLLGNYAAALALTEETVLPTTRLQGPARAQWLQARATSLWRTGQTNAAVALINSVAAAPRTETPVLLGAADFLANAGLFSNELKWREVLWQRDPKRLEWIIKKGHAELRAGQAEAAISTLTQALVLEPTSPSARLFRAIAALRAGKLEDARQDYEKLLNHPASAPSALFGLGSIAWHERDTNAMILYYQAFLTNSVTAAPQTAVANQRLKDWQDE
ncbi:MAG: tetratricopeptide repeat protein [Verrucomicrobiota bacterium]